MLTFETSFIILYIKNDEKEEYKMKKIEMLKNISESEKKEIAKDVIDGFINFESSDFYNRNYRFEDDSFDEDFDEGNYLHHIFENDKVSDEIYHYLKDNFHDDDHDDDDDDDDNEEDEVLSEISYEIFLEAQRYVAEKLV